MLRSSFRLVARPNLPPPRGRKPWLTVGIGLLLAGCGGGSSAAPTQTVRGDRFAFAAPEDWRVSRTSHVVSAAPRNGGAELISVSVFRIARPFRTALWPSVVRELDRVAGNYARKLPGRLTSSATLRVAGRRARRYEFVYRRSGVELGQRLVFLFEGRREFQLLCRYPEPPSRDFSETCERLATSFRAPRA